MVSSLLVTLYFIVLFGIAIYGLNALVMSGLFLWHRRQTPSTPLPPAEWPKVTVQLPIFNERFVVERLIDAVAALDYPRDRLSIQVLDDSTDETRTLARVKVAYHAAQGVNISYIQRPDRIGFKAGALAYGLRYAEGDFIAIFDADFVPPADFLQRIIPYFANPRAGMVQARWGHLNAEASAFTRAQAIALDGHFIIEQTARSRSGLMLNFNGSGGVWRRDCIQSAGGWQSDTICEDFDLSYRAQLAGWKLLYAPQVVTPAEIPPTLTAYKRQQFRWAKGSIQCLGKLGGRLLTSSLSPWQKIQAILHMGGYLIHPLMLAMIVLGLPVMLMNNVRLLPLLSVLGLTGFTPPLLFALSQWAIYPDWKRRFAYFPFLVLLGGGVALNTTWAVFEAVIGRNPQTFLRTPKFRAEGRQNASMITGYHLPVNWTTWAELVIAVYCLIEAGVALNQMPGLTIFMLVYALSYLYTAGLGFWQSWDKIPFFARPQPSQSAQ
jgi:cellulose synthase/poly-beta-1,6-N-acetylglucosamine synthase-like glycosyltransferase